MERIKIELTTLSNLFIGDTCPLFEIGGIDQYKSTPKTDFYGISFIGSRLSLKGAAQNYQRHGDWTVRQRRLKRHIKIIFKDLKEKNIRNLEKVSLHKIEPMREKGN